MSYSIFDRSDSYDSFDCWNQHIYEWYVSLGIATILLGIAVTTNNFFGYVLGFLGFGVAVAGCFLKDKH